MYRSLVLSTSQATAVGVTPAINTETLNALARAL
jgi:hypothetical protein